MNKKFSIVALVLSMGLLLGGMVLSNSANAWFGNNQCKKAITSANKTFDDWPILSRIIINNKKCFDPSLVANAQLCIKYDYTKPSIPKSEEYLNACFNFPKRF